jgi:hypothetical protein
MIPASPSPDNLPGDDRDVPSAGREESLDFELRQAGLYTADLFLAAENVLAKLDIEHQYRSWGVEITAKRPSSKGWLKCLPFYGDGTWASINVGSGGGRGWYVECDGEKKVVSLSFLNFAVRWLPAQFPSWFEALRHFAGLTGVPLPTRRHPAVVPPPKPRHRAELLPHHRAELLKSGLSDAQIKACGIHSVVNPKTVRDILNWRGGAERLGACIGFPYFSPLGKPLGYCRLKPDRPRIDSKGKVIKYESPRGKSSHVYYPPQVRDALDRPEIALFITEGEKKAAKAAQEGFACLGLGGVWGWMKPRPTFLCRQCSKGKRRKCRGGRCGKKFGERELVDELAAIAFDGRQVFVCFDSDAATNPQVRLAEKELGEALRLRGAKVKVVRLPQGPGGEKVGLDDYLVSHGAEAFDALLMASESARQARATAWAGHLLKRGIYLDSNPIDGSPGSLIRRTILGGELQRTLTVLNSHDDCYDAVRAIQGWGDVNLHSPDVRAFGKGLLDAEKYPERTKAICENFEEAKAAEKAGLPAGAAVCPGCPFKKGCRYLAVYEEAENADHRVMTKRRASMSLLRAAEDSQAVFIVENGRHGDSLQVFAAPLRVNLPFSMVLSSLETIKAAAAELQRLSAKKGKAAAVFWDGLLKSAADLVRFVTAHGRRKPQPPPPSPEPYLWLAQLWQQLKALVTDAGKLDGLTWHTGEFHAGRLPDAAVVRLTLALATGELESLELLAPEPGSDRVRMVGRYSVALPDAPVIVVDPTLTAGRLAAVIRRPVHDITDPSAARILKISQVPEHATGAQRPSAALKTIRGFLGEHPSTLVGILLNKKLLGPVVEGLTAEEKERVRLAVWYEEPSDLADCEVILALGCPTASNRHVRKRLLQSGEYEAAFRDGGWGKQTWVGTTEDGRSQTVEGKRYADEAWHKAYMEITRGWLLGTLDRFDVPITVVSSLDLGFPLVPPPLSEVQAKLLAALEGELKALENKELGVSARNALLYNRKSDVRAFRALTVPTARLAQKAGIGPRAAQGHLKEMESRGRVRREGTRKEGGWTLGAKPS